MIFRDVLTLWKLGKDTVDIAQAYHIPESDACNLLHRAKDEFRNTNPATTPAGRTASEVRTHPGCGHPAASDLGGNHTREPMK